MVERVLVLPRDRVPGGCDFTGIREASEETMRALTDAVPEVVLPTGSGSAGEAVYRRGIEVEDARLALRPEVDAGRRDGQRRGADALSTVEVVDAALARMDGQL